MVPDVCRDRDGEEECARIHAPSRFHRLPFVALRWCDSASPEKGGSGERGVGRDRGGEVTGWDWLPIVRRKVTGPWICLLPL